jgi:hypothetical protein
MVRYENLASAVPEANRRECKKSREILEDFTMGANNLREILEGAEDYTDLCGGAGTRF